MPKLNKDEIEIVEKVAEEIAEELGSVEDIIEDDKIIEEKDFDEFEKFYQKEKQVSAQITNEDILNELKDIKNVSNGTWTQALKIRGQISDQTNDINFMKLHHTKLNVFMSFVLLCAGYVIGTQHSHISPYGKIVWEFVTSFIK